MQVPLQLAFHKIDKPDWAEDEIRARVERLNTIYDRLTGCRVRVDQRANNAGSNTPPVVHIEMSVPGTKELVVSYEPDRLQQKYQDPDLRTAINDAFGIAERQLVEFKRQREGHTKTVHHDAQNQFLGQVADMHADEDYGFLMTKEGGLLYFHRNSLLNGDFDALKRGDEVHYVEDVGDTGPIATKVRPAAGTQA